MYTDIDLLTILGVRKKYNKYSGFIKDLVVSDEAEDIIQDLQIYYDSHSGVEEIDWEQFQVWFRITRHPSWKRAKMRVYGMVLDNCAKQPMPEDDSEVIQRFVDLDYASQLVILANEISEGKSGASMDMALSITKEWQSATTRHAADPFVDHDIDSLLSEMVRDGGFSWRLKELNDRVGPYQNGDLIIVAGRPNSGKTSFLADQMTSPVDELADDEYIWIVSNEESGSRILGRAIQTYLGMSGMDIVSRIEAGDTVLKNKIDWFKEKFKVTHRPGIAINQIEAILADHPGCVMMAINNLDKLSGFDRRAGTEAERIRKVAWWARDLASQVGPVFGVMQADAQCEGELAIDMSHIFGSKTGIQGEADLMLIIGTDGINDNQRCINIPKNKLPGGVHTDPTLRHKRFMCNFDGATGRFS